jgi:hypothetical protein
MSRLPTTGIIACRSQNGLHAFHAGGYRTAAALYAPAEIIDGQGDLPVADASLNILCHHYSGLTSVAGNACGIAAPGFCFTSVRDTECLGRPIPAVLTIVQTFAS